MKSTLVFCTLLSLALTKPNNYLGTKGGSDGYFQQQYQYSSSSSSYKNNELEHKTDDEGYYSKHGDLSGRVEPKVNSYSQHSEYQNPKFQHGQGGQGSQANDFYIQQTLGQGGGLGSNYNSGSSSGYTNGQGYQNGLSGQYGLSGGSSSSSFKAGYSASNSYSGGTAGSLYPSAQLESLSQQLHDDLSRQLQQVLSEQRRHQSSSSSSSYSIGTTGGADYGSNANVQYLERELKNNLTALLQDAINRQYGQQSQKDSHYYSVSSGGSQSSQPNYSTQDLERLRQQLEAKLIKELQEGVQTNSLQASRSSSSSSSTSFNTGSTGYTGYQPGSQTIHLTPGSHNTNTFGSTGSSYTTGTYTPNPTVHLTDITKQVEDNLIDQLNQAVSQKIQNYQSSSSYSSSYSSGNSGYPTRPDYQSELQFLIEELKNNLTRQLNDELTRNYGRQEQRGTQYYTISSGVPYSTPNYGVRELEALKQQVQDKLVRQLQEKFRQQYNQYTQSYGSSSNHYTSGSSYSNSGSTGTHYGTTGTVYPATTGSHDSYGSAGYTSTNGMAYVPGTFVVVGNVPSQLQDITKELHSNLAHQLQTALAEQQRRYQQQSSSYTSSSSYSPQYDQQLILQQLTEELKRNLTQQLDQSLTKHYGRQGQKGSYHYTVSSGGSYQSSPNYNSQQLTDVTSQLQDSLIKQLQQGLSQQNAAYSSYSANSSFKSSSGSGGYMYNPTYSHDSLRQRNQYSQSSGSTGILEDCEDMQGDDNFHRHGSGSSAYHQHRSPQTYGHVQFGGQQTMNSQEDLTQQTEEGVGQLQIGGQQTIDSKEDLSQQTETGMGQLQIGGQQTIDSKEDLVQQTQDALGNLQVGNYQQHGSVGHYQQTESGIGQMQIGQYQEKEVLQEKDKFGQQYQNPSHTDLTQQTMDDLTQQVETGNHGKLQIGGQQQVDLTQKFDNQGQFSVDKNKDKYIGHHGNYGGQQQVDLTQQTMDGLSQQVESGSHGNLEIGGQQQVDLTQQTMDGLTQQVETGSHGRLEIGGQQQMDLTQQFDNQGQFSIDKNKDKYVGQHGSYGGQQHVDLTQQTMDGLTQQVETGSHGSLEIGGQQQMDLTQQSDNQPQLPTNKYVQQHYGSYGGQQQVDLTQQTSSGSSEQEEVEAVTHQYGNNQAQLQFGSHGKLELQGQEQEDLTQQTQDAQGQLMVGQGNVNYGNQHLQLTQRPESGFGQHQMNINHGSTQHTEDGFGQLQTGQHQTNINQGLTQQTEDQFGQLQVGQQQTNIDHGLTQQTEEGFGTGSHLTPGHADASGALEFGNQQTIQNSHPHEQQGFLGAHGNHKYVNGYNEKYDYRHSSHSSASYNHGNSYHGAHGHGHGSDSFSGQLHYGTPQQQADISETTGDLNQQQIEKQNAQLIESLNQHIKDQKQSGHNSYSGSAKFSSSSQSSSSFSASYDGEVQQTIGSDHIKSDSEVEAVGQEEVSGKEPVTERGFWNKVGNKIENAYLNVKQKAGNIANKISSSVG